MYIEFCLVLVVVDDGDDDGDDINTMLTYCQMVTQEHISIIIYSRIFGYSFNENIFNYRPYNVGHFIQDGIC